MTISILKYLPEDEARIIQAFIGSGDDTGLSETYERLGVPESHSVDRLSIATAQVLLTPIQNTLPNWGCLRGDGTFVVARKKKSRIAGAKASFIPKLVCTINWADSGPGFSWPESYHITLLPGLGKYIVTASRDSDDLCGCTDHALAALDSSLSPTEAAGIAIRDYWEEQVRGWDQGRWAYLFDEGLVNTETAKAWADEVWGDDQCEEEEE